MRYIKSYNNTTDLKTDLDDGKLDHPYVAKINDTIDFNSIGTDWKKEYFTIIALSDGTISYSHKEGSNPMFYSINEGEWIETTVSVDITVSKNDMIRFKSNRGNQAYNQETFTSGGTALFEVAGNLMSLVAGDDFATYVPKTNATGTDGELYCSFKYFFKDCEGLMSAKNLIIKYCDNESFSDFFNGCLRLLTAPKLPATTLANSCYSYMFANCQNLASAPALPAMTLANNCYYHMFDGCTNLTSAPALPATTLADSCYCGMFYWCTSLTQAPALPATTLATNCYNSMFWNCTSLKTAPVLPATTLTNSCYSYMFQGCTSLITAPELPATTLTSYCYAGMFFGCTSLNYIKCLAEDVSADGCTSVWVNDVASTGTFVKAASMTKWTTGENGIPDGWTAQNA